MKTDNKDREKDHKISAVNTNSIILWFIHNYFFKYAIIKFPIHYYVC